MLINQLCKKYDKLEVINNLTLELTPGRKYCFFGPSGCGKTTLLNIISGILPATSGSIEGIENKTFSYIFQENRLLPWETVKNNLIFALEGRFGKEKAVLLAKKYLDFVYLTKFQDNYPYELSGGMKQRVAIARALAYNGDVLLMDEPFRGLDFELKKEFITYILQDWNSNDRYFIFVTHDIDEALYIADTIIVFSGPPLTIQQQINIDIPNSERLEDHDLMKGYKEKLLTKK